MSTDAQIIHDFYKNSRPKDLKSDIKRKAKDFVKKSIGQEKAKKIMNLFNK